MKRSYTSFQVDPRESMRCLPWWMQLSLTVITGKPYRGQQPSRWTLWQYLIGTLGCLIVGLLLSILATHRPGLGLLLPLGWLLTTGSMRTLQVVVMHHCSHVNVTGNKSIDTYMGQWISILLMIQDFDSYTSAHRIHHSLKGHLTTKDETLIFLFKQLKLRPGMSKQECWRTLYQALWSPRFHLDFLYRRFRACFLSASLSHNIEAYSFWFFVLRSVFVMHMELPFLLGWVIPMTLLYQICTCLRLIVEHEFPELQLLTDRDKRFVAEATKAVFLGDPTPNPSLEGSPKFLAWCRWWLRLLFIHVPCRFMILPGDTPVHDFHTRHPGNDDWVNAIWLREAELVAGCVDWPLLYEEHWGLGTAIDATFESISQLPPGFIP